MHDLLDPKTNKQSLKVREHNVLGPYVDGLSQLAVTSFQVCGYVIITHTSQNHKMYCDLSQSVKYLYTWLQRYDLIYVLVNFWKMLHKTKAQTLKTVV